MICLNKEKDTLTPLDILRAVALAIGLILSLFIAKLAPKEHKEVK